MLILLVSWAIYSTNVKNFQLLIHGIPVLNCRLLLISLVKTSTGQTYGLSPNVSFTHLNASSPPYLWNSMLLTSTGETGKINFKTKIK